MELKSDLIEMIRSEKEWDVYCPIGHKTLHLEAGQGILRCCGKPMEIMK